MSSVADTLDGLSRSPSGHSSVSRAIPGTSLSKQHRLDLLFRLATRFFAFLVLLLLAGIIVSLVAGSLPALRAFGPGFVTSPLWNPVTEQFGALVPIVGTLVTSFIALLIGVPVSFGIALFLTELSPIWMRRPLGTAIELLAAIPSIIYGMWGLFVFAPAFSQLQPWLTATLGAIPLAGMLFQGPPMGIGVLTAGIILAIMVIPFIAAVMRDVFEIVPSVLKESAYALGSTTWEVVWNVVLPYTKVGVVGGVMLVLGRALGPALFLTMTPPAGATGGLSNAIAGSLIMAAMGTLIGTPIGMMAGIYLAEFGSRGWLAPATRFINDILLSAPSIVVGLFVYEVYVIHTRHFSAWAGTMALALIVIPVVIRTTENMLRLVPDNLREAAAALGAPQWKVITLVTVRAAKAGIITGILLAVARISGETAPLLFTALNNQFWSLDMNQPMANLPVVIFQFAMSPYENWQHLAWAGALLITMGVLLLNILARVFFRNRTPTY